MSAQTEFIRVGRPEAEVDMEVLMDFLEKGVTQKEMAQELGVSIPTLAKKIAQLQASHDVILSYRKLKSLHLTELQHLLLSNITEDKIAQASLGEIATAYKKLADSETAIEGTKEIGEVKGLVAHLLFLEKQRQAVEHPAQILTDLEYDESDGVNKVVEDIPRF